MAHMHMSPVTRVTPKTVTPQSITVKSRWSSDLPRSSDANFPSDPKANPDDIYEKVITYDIYEEKSAEQLLNEIAQERSGSEKVLTSKWENFTKEVDKHVHKTKYSHHLVKSLDDKKQWAALHYAVFNNNTYVCDRLTDKNRKDKHFRCDVNILTGNGENVLHIAARSNFIWEIYDEQVPPIIDTLIHRGADVNHPDDEGRTPLHLAVMRNRLPLVEFLLNHNANIFTTTTSYTNVLHFIFIPIRQSYQQLSYMFQIITKKLESPTTTWCSRWRSEQKNLAQMRTFDNRTPLVFAVSHPAMLKGKDIIIKLLDEMGINSNSFARRPLSKPNVDQTQIFIAIEQVARKRRLIASYDHLQPILDVCDSDTYNQLFHFSCRHNNIKLLDWLIEQSSTSRNPTTQPRQIPLKLDLNKRDHAGYTPLLTAVFYRSIDCVEHLLKYSNTSPLFVKIDAVNADGENILHICAKHSMPINLFEIIWKSVEKFGLLKQQDCEGNSPLHIAASNREMEMCERFLTASKDSTKLLLHKNIHGQTAAHMAIEAVPHRIGPERYYIDKHEKDKHKKDKDENAEADTAEDEKERNFGLSILKLIWNITETPDKLTHIQSAGFLERDDDEKTCLHLAAENGHQEIVKFLVEKVGFEVDVIADRRLTPLHLACENGHGGIIAYLIEHGASPTFRNAELYNSLEIAIINQNKKTTEALLTLPNWRELMRNAQRIPNSEGYDTPMRKLIRYMPQVAIWFIEENLTRTIGGQGKHVFKKVYDYEFYMDTYQVKHWHTQGTNSFDEKESCSEHWHRRGFTAICCCDYCCQPKRSEENSNDIPYTDDAYVLIRNHPLIIASEQSQCPELVQHPYNHFLQGQWFRQNYRLFYWIRGISFVLYAAFLAIWTALILLGTHPQYFYDKIGRNMTLDLDSCENVSRTLTASNDSEALKTTTYKNLKISLYAFLIFFVVENGILIYALFPRIFRTIDYILEISAFVLTFVFIYDWKDWQNPVVFRCPIQYQIGSMGLLLAWLGLLSYVKRSTWFDMGVFVVMIQLIGFKFLRFIPVLLIIICGFGFTHWMLLPNQTPFQTPISAVIRTGLLMFDLGYEDHLYNNTIYYQIIFFITILSAIVFCIFVLNLLISVAVGEIPSLTVQGKIWQSQMLYDLASDYSIISLQLIRFGNFITCGFLGRWLIKQRIQPIFILEDNLKSRWPKRAWKYMQKHFFDEKIQDDVIPINSSNNAQKD